MAVPPRSLRIAPQLVQIHAAQRFVAEAARQIGLDDEAVYRCELAVEEMLTNIIEHGYSQKPPNTLNSSYIEIIVDMKSEQRLTILISDDAPPFNPFNRPSPDPSQSLWERSGGGWGLHFVKQFMDHVEYHYVNQRNQVLLEKRLRTSAG